MLRRLYDWCIAAANKPYATWLLGIVSFVEWLNEKKDPLHPIISTHAERDGVDVEVAMQYTGAYADQIFSYANNIGTVEGGILHIRDDANNRPPGRVIARSADPVAEGTLAGPVSFGHRLIDHDGERSVGPIGFV